MERNPFSVAGGEVDFEQVNLLTFSRVWERISSTALFLICIFYEPKALAPGETDLHAVSSAKSEVVPESPANLLFVLSIE